MVAFGSDRLGVFGGYGTPRGPNVPDAFERDSSFHAGPFSGTYVESRGWTNELHEYHLEKGIYTKKSACYYKDKNACSARRILLYSC